MQYNPTMGSIRFCCPHCGALAHQYWYNLYSVSLNKDESPFRYDREKVLEFKAEFEAKSPEDRPSEFEFIDEWLRSSDGAVFQSNKREDPYSYRIFNLEASKCDSCSEVAIWLEDRMVFPVVGPTGSASSDMPERVGSLYNEAAAVFPTSPRSCAALLRLALQHLLSELGESGKNINDDINSLIEKGLDDDIAKTMHALRIVGNEAVHPGQIDIDDEPYIAEALFDLLDQIVDQLITKPRKRAALWERLPTEKRNEVERLLNKRNGEEQ